MFNWLEFSFKRTRKIYKGYLYSVSLLQMSQNTHLLATSMDFPATIIFYGFKLNFIFHFVENKEAILRILWKSDSYSAIRVTSSAYNNVLGTLMLCSENVSVRFFIRLWQDAPLFKGIFLVKKSRYGPIHDPQR